MGNVSQILPTIHPHIAICAADVAGHSIEFRDAAVTARADEVTLLAGILVAETAIELFRDPALVEAAWREFRERAADRRADVGWPGGRCYDRAAPCWTSANRRRPEQMTGALPRARRLGRPR